MVKIINAHLREGENGKNYVSLELQGDLTMVQSSNTGRFYATAKKCFLFSTFSEKEAKELIGSKIPGSIERVESDPYDFTIPQTGEVIKLAHTYTYSPIEGVTVQQNPKGLVPALEMA